MIIVYSIIIAKPNSHRKCRISQKYLTAGGTYRLCTQEGVPLDHQKILFQIECVKEFLSKAQVPTLLLEDANNPVRLSIITPLEHPLINEPLSLRRVLLLLLFGASAMIA
jgi:hypothetical protein